MTPNLPSRFNADALLGAALSVAACFPLFSLIIKGWVSGILFTSTLIAILLLVRFLVWGTPGSLQYQQNKEIDVNVNRLVGLFVIAFSLPLLSVALGQILQGHWNVSRFDAPSRYLLGLIVFLALARFRTIITSVLEFAIPASSILTTIFIPFVPVTVWSTYPDRLSNHFIDPLIFGQVSLTLGVMSLLTIGLNGKRAWFITFFKLIGAAAGIYLSLRSGSKTGWLAIPLILFLWTLYYSTFSKWKTVILALFVTFFGMLAIYSASSRIQDRANLMVSEVTQYRWNAMNLDTSVGHRISYIRIGWHYFLLRPLSGWGDESLTPYINDVSISVFASQSSRDELLAVGFHNDFIANMVRYGLGGLLATIAIFVAPLMLFGYCLRYKPVESYAMLGITYVLIQSSSSLSYHVLDFKFMASFYALMVSILIGIIIQQLRKQSN